MRPLTVPTFARLDEYCGVWAMEQKAFRCHWEAALRFDLSAHIKSQMPKSGPENPVQMVKGKAGKSIALIQAVGTLMKQRPSLGGTSTVDLRRQIRQSAVDPNISAILIAIDSPGGTVAGIDDLARDIRAVRRKKPVWAQVNDLTASAGYWIASQTEAIYANSPTALIGSVGSIAVVHDASKAADTLGVKVLVFSTGPLKGIGIEGTQVTDDQSAYIQSLVDDAQEHFDAAVRQGRGMSAAQLKDVRSGALFPAAAAVERKLIDGIRGLDSTLDALAAAA